MTAHAVIFFWGVQGGNAPMAPALERVGRLFPSSTAHAIRLPSKAPPPSLLVLTLFQVSPVVPYR